MASLNRVVLIGNLGQDPEIRSTQNGMDVANLSIATKEVSMKDGQKTETTEWHRIVVWGKLAKSCATYLHKGSSVAIEGKLQTRKYNKNGVDHYSTEIVATNVMFLTPRKDEQQSGSAQPSYEPIEFDISNIPF